MSHEGYLCQLFFLLVIKEALMRPLVTKTRETQHLRHLLWRTSPYRHILPFFLLSGENVYEIIKLLKCKNSHRSEVK